MTQTQIEGHESLITSASRLRSLTLTLLKVPKCEIFDGSDFHDFYIIKSLWEGNFGVKIKNLFFNI
jgi:hypothetical protein